MTGVRRAESDADVAGAMHVRYVVFVEEQGVPVDLERDERDASADHVVAVSDGTYVGAGRLVLEEPGYHGLDASLGPVGHLGRQGGHRARRLASRCEHPIERLSPT